MAPCVKTAHPILRPTLEYGTGTPLVPTPPSFIITDRGFPEPGRALRAGSDAPAGRQPSYGGLLRRLERPVP